MFQNYLFKSANFIPFFYGKPILTLVVVVVVVVVVKYHKVFTVMQSKFNFKILI